MKPKHKAFLENMRRQCETHADWLVLVNLMMPTLINDQDVLIDLIIAEAEQEVVRARGEGEARPAEVARFVTLILQELSLRLTVTDSAS